MRNDVIGYFLYHRIVRFKLFEAYRVQLYYGSHPIINYILLSPECIIQLICLKKRFVLMIAISLQFSEIRIQSNRGHNFFSCTLASQEHSLVIASNKDSLGNYSTNAHHQKTYMYLYINQQFPLLMLKLVLLEWSESKSDGKFGFNMLKNPDAQFFGAIGATSGV